jgi:hypothetical protein
MAPNYGMLAKSLKGFDFNKIYVYIWYRKRTYSIMDPDWLIKSYYFKDFLG